MLLCGPINSFWHFCFSFLFLFLFKFDWFIFILGTVFIFDWWFKFNEAWHNLICVYYSSIYIQWPSLIIFSMKLIKYVMTISGLFQSSIKSQCLNLVAGGVSKLAVACHNSSLKAALSVVCVCIKYNVCHLCHLAFIQWHFDVTDDNDDICIIFPITKPAFLPGSYAANWPGWLAVYVFQRPCQALTISWRHSCGIVPAGKRWKRPKRRLALKRGKGSFDSGDGSGWPCPTFLPASSRCYW